MNSDKNKDLDGNESAYDVFVQCGAANGVSYIMQHIIIITKRIFEKVIGINSEFFVGDTVEEDLKAGRPTMPVDTCLFGENYFFTLNDMRTVVENLPIWCSRYGSLEAIGQEVKDWHDYSVNQCAMGKTYINLFSWLCGCPKDAECSDVDAHQRKPRRKGGNNGGKN